MWRRRPSSKAKGQPGCERELRPFGGAREFRPDADIPDDAGRELEPQPQLRPAGGRVAMTRRLLGEDVADQGGARETRGADRIARTNGERLDRLLDDALTSTPTRARPRRSVRRDRASVPAPFAVAQELNVVDRRTLAKLLVASGGTSTRLPGNKDEFLKRQQFIDNQAALSAVQAALVSLRSPRE